MFSVIHNADIITVKPQRICMYLGNLYMWAICVYTAIEVVFPMWYYGQMYV